MNILLLSGYDAASHRRWRTQLVSHLPQWQWQVSALPPRFFSWRLKGNPLSWVYTKEGDALRAPYDRIVATSMVDLAVLRGLMPHLATIPTIVYFHENQFAYPIRERAVQREVFHFCMHNLTTACCADAILFNSNYNRDTFLDGVRTMMKKMPDLAPKQLADELEERASVLPVPLEQTWFQPRETSPTGPLTILWNHRWEYDKAPERMFAALQLLDKRDVPFKVHVVGQQFRQQPPEFDEAKQWLGTRVGYWGYIESGAEYRQCIAECDIVLSTALHDFQGLAMLEAVAAGCRPVAPARLAYPQWFPESCCYPSHPDDPQQEAEALANHLETLANQVEILRQQDAPDIQHLSWEHLSHDYQSIIESTQPKNSTTP
jgi:glycosyltransferase involved in cell wall biosynthesis